jgi:hypothetical protein
LPAIDRDAKLRAFLAAQSLDICQRVFAIDRGFTRSEQIEIGAVQYQDVFHGASPALMIRRSASIAHPWQRSYNSLLRAARRFDSESPSWSNRRYGPSGSCMFLPPRGFVVEPRQQRPRSVISRSG